MVSVVIGVYNGADLLGRTLDSVFNQDLDTFEVVVVDDGSTDGTPAVLEAYAHEPSLRVVRLATNGGLTRALIRGVREASGDYVARIDAGDLMRPDRLRRQAAVLARCPDVGVVASKCDVEIRREDGVVRAFRSVTASTHDEVVRMLPFRNPVTHVSVMFRKTSYAEAGGYRAELTTSQDYDLWVRMARVTKFHVLDEALTKVIYDMESSISYNQNKKQIKNALRIKSRAIRRGDLPAYPTVLSLFKHTVMFVLPLRMNEWLREGYRKVKSRALRASVQGGEG